MTAHYAAVLASGSVPYPCHGKPVAEHRAAPGGTGKGSAVRTVCRARICKPMQWHAVDKDIRAARVIGPRSAVWAAV